MKPTAPKLIRWAGLSAMAAGIIFVVIQPIHPPDVLSSVTTDAWAIIQSAKVAMCILGLLGLTGLYARQANEAGWLGLVGYLLFSLFPLLTIAVVFAEAFILPLLATEAPTFVHGFLGLYGGYASEVNLGALQALPALSGLAVLLGCLLFGIATLRAGILPRGAAGVFAFGGPVSALVVTLLPHELERLAAVPIGVGVAWLGYALWSQRREQALRR
jgi:hypothetical protein